MAIKGFAKLAAHVPELNTTGGRLKIAASFFGIFGLTTWYFIITDRIPTWTIDSQIVVMSLGFLLFSRYFTQQKSFLEKYKEAAYRQAFGRFALPGLAIIFAAFAHIQYMNGPKITLPPWVTLLKGLGWLNLAIGTALWIRAVATFGVDNLTMLYVYFPEEGSLINSNLYGIMRHPIYGAALRVGVGLALLNMGIYALSFAVLLPLGLFGWVRLVEEKELIGRFPTYIEYRRKTPAFFPRLNRIVEFFQFLFTGR